MRLVSAVLLILTIHPLWSESLWNCHISFRDKHRFEGISPWKKIAAKKVIEQCKNKYQHPKSCQLKKIHCHLNIDGDVQGRYWQCLAMDAHGIGFKNQPESSYDSAAIESMALCKHKSHIPDTCSLNTITCHEL